MATKRSAVLADKLKEASASVVDEVRRTTEHVVTRIEAMRKRLDNHDRRRDPRAQLKLGVAK